MPDVGHVDMRLKVIEKYAKLHENSVDFDVVLDVQGQNIQAHGFVLAAHSNFFQVLLHGRNFKEADDEIVKVQAPADAFKILLSYMYTGTVDLHKLSLLRVTELLELSHRYELPELEVAIANYLRFAVDPENACQVLRVATLIDNRKLQKQCQFMICLTIEGIFENELELSFEMIHDLLIKHEEGRNEIKWFEAVQSLTSQQGFCSENQKQELLELINFDKMTMKQLVGTVQQAKVMDEDDLFDLMQNQSFDTTSIVYDANLISKNTSVTEGENSKLWGCTSNKITSHDAGHETCISVDLGALFCFNHIKIVLGNLSNYLIEISKDGCTWVEAIDFSQVVCIGQQTLFFPETLGRYIKIVGFPRGTNFEVWKLEVMLCENPPMQFNGLIFPSENVAVLEKAEAVITDLSTNRYTTDNTILRLKSVAHRIKKYFFASKINQTSFEIFFNQPYLLNSFRFKLWDHDNRKYSYKVSVSKGKLKHKIVSDKSDELLSGWQTVKFPPQKIISIVIEGTKCTVGDEIRIERFEAPAPAEIV